MLIEINALILMGNYHGVWVSLVLFVIIFALYLYITFSILKKPKLQFLHHEDSDNSELPDRLPSLDENDHQRISDLEKTIKDLKKIYPLS